MPRTTRSQDEQCSTMIVGIDFGTTYSGIAFAHSSKPGHIQVVSNWIDGRNTDKGKCPTLLTYDGVGVGVAKWGYGAVGDPNAIKWFKLLLLRPENLPPDVAASEELISARRKMMALGKQPAELVADYLRCLWAFTLDKMAKSSSKALVENSQLHVVLSVPAIWPDYAKDMMLEAAKWAGICDARENRSAGKTILDLVSEPEAAALATMMDNFDDKITSDGAPIAQVGDCFVVCDAGGGTAVSLNGPLLMNGPTNSLQDLITYKVKSVNPWKIEECVQGDGKLCGAVVLDKRFRNMLQSKVGPSIWPEICNASHIFEVQWEKVIKREFTGTSPDQTVSLPFSGNKVLARDWKPFVKFTNENLRKIFTPVTDSITELVTKQIMSIPRRHNSKGTPAKYVVLVGGLGSSHHLYECLKAGLSRTGTGPEVLQSEGDLPWTAICRGAVLHGINQEKQNGHAMRGAPSFDVESRIARRSYGTICTFEEWNPKEHLKEDRRYCPVEDCYVADYQMSWFVRAGEPIREGEIKLCEFSLTFESRQDMEGGITTELVYSDAPRPPKRCDESVKKFCDIRWPRIPSFDSLEDRLTDSGRDVKDIQYGVEMVFKGASAYFEVWHDNEKVASRNVIVDFEGSGTSARKSRL